MAPKAGVDCVAPKSGVAFWDPKPKDMTVVMVDTAGTEREQITTEGRAQKRAQMLPFLLIAHASERHGSVAEKDFSYALYTLYHCQVASGETQ